MDSIDLSGFRWKVPKAGFEWRAQKNSGDFFLHRKPARDRRSSRMRKTNPARKSPLLHREFAELPDGDRDAFLGFANQYGSLGIPAEVELEGVEGPVWAEPLKGWQKHRDQLSFHLGMLSVAEKGTVDEINFWMAILKVGEDDSSGDMDTRWEGYIDPFEPIPVREFTIREPAALHLRRIFAQGVGIHLADNIRLMPVDRKDALEFRAHPITLLGFMWAALAVEFEGVGEPRLCPTCGQEFFLSAALGVRGHRRFCSNSCKSTLYQRRRKEADKLAATGKTAAQIAKQLSVEGSSVSTDTVQRWIAKL